MHKDDILDQYAHYARGYLAFLEEKRAEITSSMAQLQRRPPAEPTREIPTVDEMIEEVLDDRPPWSILPVVVDDEVAVQLYDGGVRS